MTHTRFITALAIALLAGGAASAQNAGVSSSVTAGPLHGEAQAGGNNRANDRSDNNRTANDRDDKDRDLNCTERGVTVQGPGGSSSASVSSSSNGSTVVAGGGSPGSRTTYTECARPVRPDR
jgi:hypothetical protein